jgi:hypothetical protein
MIAHLRRNRLRYLLVAPLAYVSVGIMAGFFGWVPEAMRAANAQGTACAAPVGQKIGEWLR